MDWTAVITRNQALLVQVIAQLFAMLGTGPVTERGLRPGADAAAVFTLPRHLCNALLAILRPTESAIRRLIVIVARGLVLKARPSRPLPVGGFPAAANAGRAPSFQLIDPLKTFALDQWNAPSKAALFTHVMPDDPALAYSQSLAANEPVNAALLFNRLRAMRIALSDIPRQARRLARWRALRDLALKASRPTRMSPFRPGPPPGYRRKHLHPVDAVLKDLHYFAWEAWAGAG